jgi:putative restriction endonuclease
MARPPDVVPSVEEYAAAFRRVHGWGDRQIALLRMHYHAPARTVTATTLATAMGYARYSAANAQYGRLGRQLNKILKFNPTEERLGTLVTFAKQNNEWHWIMRPEVAAALENVGWVGPVEFTLPEEIHRTDNLFEGVVSRVMVNAYERNPEARRRCIEHYGHQCQICGIDFGRIYGVIAIGYIHVHHIRPLSEIRISYCVDPVKYLRPLCPNCHAVVHRRTPPFTIDEVRQMLEALKD